MFSERAKRAGVMLCYPFEEKRLLKWSPPYVVQPKLDGVRCRAVWADELNSYVLLSSTQHQIVSVPHIVAALNKSGLTTELDGELYCHGMSFEDIYGRTARTVNEHLDSEAIEFHIFDIITEGSQLARMTWLYAHVFEQPLVAVPFKLCSDLDEIMAHYVQILNKGYEGIIVRHIDAPYKRARSTFMMKFKPKKEDYYNVLGSVEEVDKFGKPKGSLGALICAGNDNTEFRVGSGFNQDQRQKLWIERENLPGHLVRVEYQHITPGRGVPRFPIFCEIVKGELDEQD